MSGKEMQRTSGNHFGPDPMIERMQQKVRIAELASKDQRLTPETREKNRRAAEMGKMALRMMEGERDGN